MPINRPHLQCLAIAVGIALQSMHPARASDLAADADDTANALGEITVTATRHEEALSKVPVSISAFSQDSIDTRGVKDFSDLVRFTPGVSVDTNGTNAISIRGISSSGGSGTTGIYIDDTPIQMRAIGFDPDDTLPKTFDLDRVEVLRGPQGTLFGAGSEGGTVRYILPQPSLTDYSEYAKAEVSQTEGGAPSYEAGLAVGAPVIDNVLGFRASAWYRRDGGWIDWINPTNGALIEPNANHTGTVLLRFAAAWRPADNLLITPSVIYQDRRRDNISDYWVIDSDLNRDQFRSADPNAQYEPDKYWLPMLKMQLDMKSMQLISNTSMYRRNDLSGYEGTLYNLGYYQTLGFGNNVPTLNYLNPANYPLLDVNGVHLPTGLENYRSPARVTNRQDNFTQELRLQSTDTDSRFSWTVGAFFAANKEESTEEINDPLADTLFNGLFGVPATTAFGAFGDGTPIPLLPGGDIYVNDVTSHDRQLAFFGEGSATIVDGLKVTVGLRYSRTKYTFSQYANGPQNGGLATGSGAQTENPVTPKGGISYQLDPDNLFYFTYAKGFRIGGANVPFSESALQSCGLSASPAPYSSDNTNSYEIGAKDKLFNVMRLASSIYYVRWNKIQQNVYLPSCGLQYTSNLGAAIAKGFDLQADFAVTDALSIETAFGYTDARYTTAVSNGDPVAPQNIISRGDAIIGESGIPGAPWTATVGMQYNFLLGEHKAFARFDYEWQSRNYWQSPTTDVTTTQYNPYSYNPSSTTFVQVRAGTHIGGWEIEPFIDNLFDSHTTTNFALTQLDSYNPAGSPAPLARNFTFRPRTFGVTFIYRH